MKFNRYVKVISLGVISGLFFFVANAFAQQDIGTVAQTVTKTFDDLAQLITAVSYVAGMGFGMAAILKFKAHKDNPTQIPIGTPIALLFIAAALLFLPTLFGVAGSTIFGQNKSAGGVTGTTTIYGQQ